MTTHLPQTEIASTTDPLPSVAADWLAVGVWADEPPPAEVDRATGGLLSRLRQRGDLSGKPLELTAVHEPTGLAAPRLMLVGLGKRAEASRRTVFDAGAAVTRSITTRRFDRVAMAVPDAPDALLGVGTGLASGVQGPGVHKTEPSRFPPGSLVLVGAGDVGPVRAAARGLWLARDLVNAPPSELFPESFAEVAVDVATAAKVDVEVWDEPRLERERMGALLAVARGSARPPRLVVLRYTGNPGGPTLGLVGKGVTFDSGGLSLKTNEQMVDMKCDMAGAAAVLGGVRAAAEAGLKVNLLGVLGLVENMPGGRAMKLGDVLTARNGTTIEVLNTDAEGRLVLADCLSWAADQGVSHLVDLATLTGACMVALGPDTAGLMTNHDGWGDRVLSAASTAGERVWKLPLDGHYDDTIRSKVADIRNTGGSRYGGAIAAAKFLQRFVGAVPWAHLDIAGPAWADGESATRDSGGTGFGVMTLLELAGRYAEG